MGKHSISSAIYKLENNLGGIYDKANKGNYRAFQDRTTQAVRQELGRLYRVLVVWYYTGRELPAAAEPKCEKTILCTCNRRSCIGKDPSMTVWTRGMKKVLNNAK